MNRFVSKFISGLVLSTAFLGQTVEGMRARPIMSELFDEADREASTQADIPLQMPTPASAFRPSFDDASLFPTQTADALLGRAAQRLNTLINVSPVIANALVRLFAVNHTAPLFEGQVIGRARPEHDIDTRVLYDTPDGRVDYRKAYATIVKVLQFANDSSFHQRESGNYHGFLSQPVAAVDLGSYTACSFSTITLVIRQWFTQETLHEQAISFHPL